MGGARCIDAEIGRCVLLPERDLRREKVRPPDVVSLHLATDIFSTAVDRFGVFGVRALRDLCRPRSWRIALHARSHIAATGSRRSHCKPFGLVCDICRDRHLSVLRLSSLPEDNRYREALEVSVGGG